MNQLTTMNFIQWHLRLINNRIFQSQSIDDPHFSDYDDYEEPTKHLYKKSSVTDLLSEMSTSPVVFTQTWARFTPFIGRFGGNQQLL